MKSKTCIFKAPGILLLFSVISSVAYSQTYRISGKIIDLHSKQPVDSVLLMLFGQHYTKQTHFKTDASGFYLFDSLKPGRYQMYLMQEHYTTRWKMLEITDSSVETDIALIHIDSSERIRIDDIANDDTYHGGFAVNFYNPNLSSSFKSSFNFEYIYSFKNKITPFYQIGMDVIPLKFVWHKLHEDTLINAEKWSREKYFAAYFSGFFYNRFILNKQKKTGYPGVFVDLGIGYEFPLYFRYSFKSDAKTRTTVRNIHKLNEVTGLLRIGYDVLSIKATYRFTDILKSPYPEPPPFKLGIEINFPMRYY